MAQRKQSKAQMRNLAQYRSLSDDDFDSMWAEQEDPVLSREDFETRIKDKIAEFAVDYDIDDLKINDKESLRLLVQSIISLEDYELMVYTIRSSGDVNQSNINVLDRVSKIMSDLRKDISNLQADLNITRKIRKSDKESSVISYIGALKAQAKEYYESKASYIFCPKCNMLLGTVWTLFPEENNKISLKCNRTLDDGSKCGERVDVTTKDLLETRGTNKKEIIPESML